MTIKPIRSEKDYQKVLQHIEKLFDNDLENNSHAQDELVHHPYSFGGLSGSGSG